MREFAFSIPVSGVVRVDENSVLVIVNRAETTISLETGAPQGKRMSFGEGRVMFDVLLESARELIGRKGFNRFSAPEVYEMALERHPGLKRGSFMARFIASTPDHPSHKHHKSRRDYFSCIGPGLYWLNERYRADKTSAQDANLSKR